ncbi:MAG: hypothetical protein EOP83_05150 [Verrucomicrobiaceae bacterium]|nr:MAG: hypothetical protein EOP83_05150 [Verrucomicrobiaceae bacterium]
MAIDEEAMQALAHLKARQRDGGAQVAKDGRASIMRDGDRWTFYRQHPMTADGIDDMIRFVAWCTEHRLEPKRFEDQPIQRGIGLFGWIEDDATATGFRLKWT